MLKVSVDLSGKIELSVSNPGVVEEGHISSVWQLAALLSAVPL
jgi:hypothetical protein